MFKSLYVLTLLLTSLSAFSQTKAEEVCRGHLAATSNRFCTGVDSTQNYCRGYRQAFFNRETGTNCLALKTLKAVSICKAYAVVLDQKDCRTLNLESFEICQGVKAADRRLNCHLLSGPAKIYCQGITRSNSLAPTCERD